jgi:anthranilate synthase/aminodeoxychorismate synthase-like glutamine amidotransferase
MILVIDNYDSFVYNLAQYLGELGWEPQVYRNDAINLGKIQALNPSHIVISPGPKAPPDSGISNDVILNFGGKIPILGVCLGHQCIGHVYGGVVDKALVPVHGKTSLIHHDGETIYRGVSNPFTAARYHSLVIRKDNVPPCLAITAWTDEGEIMGVRHKDYVVEGIQVHPESILTPSGHDLLGNFLSYSTAVWPKDK